MVRPEVWDLFRRRVTILVGHFGSGKTEIAVNGALGLVRDGAEVALLDLDVVKPYFRSRSTREWMSKEGVRLVVPEGDNVWADLPIIVPQVRSLLREGAMRLILDVGGDDTGARVLGSLADVIPGDITDMLLVLNFRRPFTEGADEAIATAERIAKAARQPFSGVVSNTHLMEETTPDIVYEGYRLAGMAARRMGVPVRAVTVDESLLSDVEDLEFDCPVVPMKRLIKPPFEGSSATRKTGPLFVLN